MGGLFSFAGEMNLVFGVRLNARYSLENGFFGTPLNTLVLCCFRQKRITEATSRIVVQIAPTNVPIVTIALPSTS
jgi:hypothetical protein